MYYHLAGSSVLKNKIGEIEELVNPKMSGIQKEAYFCSKAVGLWVERFREEPF